jgi:hypothetical protein
MAAILAIPVCPVDLVIVVRDELVIGGNELGPDLGL